MSINLANSIASGAMQAAQYQMSITSANIANADTAGYTAKKARLVSDSTTGSPAGVSSAEITSTVNRLLTRQLASSSTTNSATTVAADFAQQLQAIYGQTTSTSTANTGTSIVALLNTLETNITNLASTPESSSLKTAVVSSIENVTSQLNDLSSKIQTLRNQADQGISDAVTDANTQITTLASLNKQILQAQGRSESTADLVDKQNAALLALSQDMNIRYTVASNGTVQVYTGDGAHALVDNTAHTLTFNKATYVSKATTVSAGLSAVTLDGADLTSAITSGKIGALTTERDTTLVNAQSELDQMATTFMAKINAIGNTGTASPAPSSITGATKVSSTDAFSGTGTARVAVVDSSGELVSYGDIDLSTMSSVGDVVSALNGMSGLTASIDTDGHLKVVATATDTAVSFGAMTGSVGTSELSLSGFFGLNDLVTGTGAGDLAIKDSLKTKPESLSTATLSSATAPAAGDVMLSAGDMTVSNALSDAMTKRSSFAASGNMPARVVNFAGFMSEVISQKAIAQQTADGNASTANSSYQALSVAQSSASGVNMDEETQNLQDFEKLYEAAARILTTANSMFTALLNAVS